MGGHAAAVRQRINRKGNDPAIGELKHGRACNNGVSNAFPAVLGGL